MDGRFVGHIANGELSYFSVEPPATVHGPSGSTVTVFVDGSVSNVKDLEDEASRRGDAAASDPSGWIGLAYRWWGGNLSRHVLGQYAIAIIEKPSNAVWLIQDSLGIQPLFYKSGHDEIAFASRLDDLVRFVRPEALDSDYFAEALVLGIPDTERTPYAGVRRIRHGASISWRVGRQETRWPWTPRTPHPPGLTSDSELEEELRARLTMAVDRMLPAKGRAWCELSGGLDSTAVLAVGLRAGHLLDAFTFVSSDRDDDGDTIAARDAAALLEIPWHTIEATKTRPFSTIPGDFRGEPGTDIFDARRVAYRTLLRDNGVDVVLTGVGGDVVFGSPDCLPHHLADPLIMLNPKVLWRTLRTWERGDPRQRSILFWFTHYTLRSSIRHLRRERLDAPGLANRLPRWIRSDIARGRNWRLAARMDSVLRHPLPGRQALWEEVYGQAGALGVGSVPSPWVEFRHPLLDRDLVSFMLTIPYRQRQRVEIDRYLERRALSAVLPEFVLRRRSKGSGQPSLDLGLRTSGAWREILTDHPRIVAEGLVDGPAWRAEVERACFGVYESLRHFVMAASIESWLRRLEQGLPEPIVLRGGPPV